MLTTIASARVGRWVAGLLLACVAIASLTLYYRHYIAEGFVRRLLSEQGYTVETVSVDRLDEAAAEIGDARVFSESGIAVNVTDLRVTYALFPFKIQRASVERLEIVIGQSRATMSGAVYDESVGEDGPLRSLTVDKVTVWVPPNDHRSSLPTPESQQSTRTLPVDRIRIKRAELSLDGVVSGTASNVLGKISANGAKIDSLEVDTVEVETLGSVLPQLETEKSGSSSSYLPKSVSIDRVNIKPMSLGLPQLSAEMVRGTLSGGLDIGIGELASSVFGGEIQVSDAVYSVKSASGRFPMTFREIDIEELLRSYPNPNLHAVGRVDGEAIIDITGMKPRVSAGKFSAVPPGGVIRYEAQGENVTDSRMKNVYEALRHLNYTEMQGEIATTEGGRLKVKIAIKGANPDMKASPPIHLNLDVEEDLEALMKTWKVWKLFR